MCLSVSIPPTTPPPRPTPPTHIKMIKNRSRYSLSRCWLFILSVFSHIFRNILLLYLCADCSSYPCFPTHSGTSFFSIFVQIVHLIRVFPQNPELKTRPQSPQFTATVSFRVSFLSGRYCLVYHKEWAAGQTWRPELRVRCRKRDCRANTVPSVS